MEDYLLRSHIQHHKKTSVCASAHLVGPPHHQVGEEGNPADGAQEGDGEEPGRALTQSRTEEKNSIPAGSELNEPRLTSVDPKNLQVTLATLAGGSHTC